MGEGEGGTEGGGVALVGGGDDANAGVEGGVVLGDLQGGVGGAIVP